MILFNNNNNNEYENISDIQSNNIFFPSPETAHIEYDNEDGRYSEISDMDKEQSQARYDPRLLSEDASGYHSQAGDAGASSCYNANVRYMHGQKVFSLSIKDFDYSLRK